MKKEAVVMMPQELLTPAPSAPDDEDIQDDEEPQNSILDCIIE
jgi:hypothetical protein